MALFTVIAIGTRQRQFLQDSGQSDMVTRFDDLQANLREALKDYCPNGGYSYAHYTKEKLQKLCERYARLGKKASAELAGR